MILPRLAATMWRSTAWLAKKTPLALTASRRSQSASVTSAVWAERWMPALFTRMSMRPSSPMVRSAMACRSARRVTSVRRASARRPSLRTSSAVRLPVASSSSATTMSAPMPASSSAMARPILRPAPVTIAACPRSSIWMPSISAAPARDGRLRPLDQLEAYVVGGLDEADAGAAGDLDRPFQQLCAQPFQAGDVRLEAVRVEAEVLEAVVGLGVAGPQFLVGARARDVHRGAVLALAAHEAVAEDPRLVGHDLEREGLHVPVGGLQMDVVDPVGHGGVLSAEVSSVPRARCRARE